MCDKEEGKCDLSELSDYDIKINEIKRGEIYNGTFLVCIVYGLFAISILLASYYNERIRDIFFSEFIIFTIIFIVGSIIIISVLFYYINNYEPKKTKHINSYDTYSCPDYWNMVMLDDTEVANNFDSNISTNYFKYKCVLNNDIFNKYENYKEQFPNSNQKYSLTNNIYNTKNSTGIGTTDTNAIKGDYFSDDKKELLKNSININYGHLYKTINNSDLFPSVNSNNLYAYNKPGQILLEKDMKDIKDAIIDTSLKMNNYSFDTNSGNYSNVLTNSISDKFNPYITWNAKNLSEVDKTTKYISNPISGTSKDSNAVYYETYQVLYWMLGNNINYSYYKSFFNEKTTSRPVYAYKSNGRYDINAIFSIANFTKIGTINIDGNNIYFKSDEKIKNLGGSSFNSTNAPDFLVNYITNINPYTGTYVINSYISINMTADNIPKSNDDLRQGPIITFDNGYGRPPAITKTQIDNNSINIPVVCDTVYPAYLASVEDESKYGSDNTIRCSYAKLCGYSWSDMGCN